MFYPPKAQTLKGVLLAELDVEERREFFERRNAFGRPLMGCSDSTCKVDTMPDRDPV